MENESCMAFVRCDSPSIVETAFLVGQAEWFWRRGRVNANDVMKMWNESCRIHTQKLAEAEKQIEYLLSLCNEQEELLERWISGHKKDAYTVLLLQETKACLAKPTLP